MEATFSSWFLGPYKVSKIGYDLFLYALQPAKRTSSSFIGAILEEYLVVVAVAVAASIWYLAVTLQMIGFTNK